MICIVFKRSCVIFNDILLSWHSFYNHFDFVTVKLLRYILLPIVPFYYVITWFRNILYDMDIKKSKSYDFPVICVGNLSTGGTGKTPMVEYLIKLLKNDFVLATLSRGYGRKTKGYFLGSESSSADTIGDEPYQFYHKFHENIFVAVDEDRQHGIAQLRELDNRPDLIILDDAFQHRKVKAKFNILLTTYSDLYMHDMVLPTGDLREPRSGAKRADVIVVTKCPKLISDEEINKIVSKIKPLGDQTVFFSSIAYSKTVLNDSESRLLLELEPFTLVTGIANPKQLFNHLNDQGLNYDHIKFKDHHNFTHADITMLEKKELILTTEKDFMRLKIHESLVDKLYYLPIEVKMDDSIAFDNTIRKLVNA